MAMTAAIESLIGDLERSAATDRRCADKEEAREPPRYDKALAYRYSATASEYAVAGLRSILARHEGEDDRHLRTCVDRLAQALHVDVQWDRPLKDIWSELLGQVVLRGDAE